MAINIRHISLFEKLTQHRVLWVFLLFISAMSIWDIMGAPFFRAEPYVKIPYILVISILKATVITILYCLCRNKWFLKIPCIALIAIYSILALVNITSYLLYGFGISRKLILILAQATPTETAEFIPGLMHNLSAVFKSWPVYLFLIIFLLTVFLVRHCPKKHFTLISLTGSMLGCVAFLVFGLTFSSGRSAHILFARVAKYTTEIIIENQKYQKRLTKTTALPDTASISSEHLANTVIVIIGESAIRKHHSIYGYPLPTTPKLDAMADSLYVFTDAVASSTSTSGNMERILSFKEDDLTEGDGLDYPLVIDYFNKAGYKTFWLSNQERFGSVRYLQQHPTQVGCFLLNSIQSAD